MKRKVHAFNEAQRIGHLYAEQALKVLTPYVGKKIVKADGSFIKPLRDQLKVIPVSAPRKNPAYPQDYIDVHRAYLDAKYSSIWLKLTLCAKDSTPHTCFYQDVNIYIGSIANSYMDKTTGDQGKLTSLTELSPPRKTTVKRQEYLTKKIRELQDQATKLKYELIN